MRTARTMKRAPRRGVVETMTGMRMTRKTRRRVATAKMMKRTTKTRRRKMRRPRRSRSDNSLASSSLRHIAGAIVRTIPGEFLNQRHGCAFRKRPSIGPCQK